MFYGFISLFFNTDTVKPNQAKQTHNSFTTPSKELGAESILNKGSWLVCNYIYKAILARSYLTLMLLP